MDFKEIKDGVINNANRYGEVHGVKIDQDFAILKLYEEVGEVAQAILIHQKKSRPEKFVSEAESQEMVAKELADVVGMCMVNAHLLGIDLEKAILKKWLKKDLPS
ncbi:MAG: pyrophosphatase [Candidatus Buchananbacteria bacterium]|nr:pyrophosphatase [Candidatus Buchananbacteria bacterium]